MEAKERKNQWNYELVLINKIDKSIARLTMKKWKRARMHKSEIKKEN